MNAVVNWYHRAVALFAVCAAIATPPATALAACGVDMAEHICWFDGIPVFPLANFVQGEWQVRALVDPSDPRCADAEAVAATWSGRGVGIGIDFACHPHPIAAGGDIRWRSFTQHPYFCPPGLPICTYMQYSCPDDPFSGLGQIWSAHTYIDDDGLMLGAPPPEFSSAWNQERVNRTLISHGIGQQLNLAVTDEPQAHQLRTMNAGTRGHWSAGDPDDRVFPLQADNFGLAVVYGPDHATEHDIDFTVSNVQFDALSGPYTSWYSPFVLNDIDGTRFVCPGEPIAYELAVHNRILTNIFTLGNGTPIDVAIYASADQTFDPATDLLVATKTVTYVVQSSALIADTFTLPGSVSPNTNYYFFAMVDPDDDFAETKENNNVIQLPGYVRTKSSCP